MKRIIESAVPDEYSEIRLDLYLSKRFTYQSRSKWQSEITKGKITCNGIAVISPHKKIKTGDLIVYFAEHKEEPAVDFNYSILYEDEFIIGINKSGNLPVHPAGKFFNNTLLIDLEKKMSQKLYPVHRLDRETSGVIIFAKSSGTASILHSQYESAVKKYIAVTQGQPAENWFVVDMPIGDDKNSKVRKKRAAYPDADETAKTEFTLLLNVNKYSIIKAILHSGRLHQIRVHLEHTGNYIVGDKLYGGDEEIYLKFIEEGNTSEFMKMIEFNRTALHARSITFSHPKNQKRISIKAPLPEDMKKFITEQFN